MATYYWVGGTGTWDVSTTTNWSSSSGGSGGAGVPTVVDDVVFDSLSNGTAYTVTINAGVCRNWTLAGPAIGNVTIAGTTTMIVGGSVTWATTGITRTFTNAITFNSTTTGNTFDFGGIALVNNLTFNGVGGAWTIARSLVSGFSNTLTLTNGTLDLRGYAITFGAIASNNSNIRTLLIDETTTLTVIGTTAWSFQNTTNLTANFTDVTITHSGTGTTFNAGNLTYGTLFFSNPGSGTHTITGNPTFTNLTFTSRNSTSNRNIRFGGNPTITNLTLGTANQLLRRMSVFSDLAGVRRTLTVTNLVSPLSDIDFQDTNINGTTWTGTRLGDCGNNNNIEFPAPRTIYWNRAIGGVWTSAAWALTSGGTASVDNFPLPQDTVIFQDSGLNVGATVQMDTDWKNGTIDASARTTAMTLLHGTSSFWVFGNIFLPSNVTLSGTTGSYLFGGQNQTINIGMSTNIHAFPIQLIGANTVYNLQSSLINTSVAGLFLTAGTLNLNGFDITTGRFTSSASTTRVLNFGNNVINVTSNGNTIWNCSTVTNLSFVGDPVVNFTYSSNVGIRTAIQGILAGGNYPDFNITAGSDTFTLSSSYYVGNLNFTGFGGTWTSTTSGFIADSLFVPPSTTIGAQGGTISFVSNTAPVKSIILSGKALDQSINFNGNGGSWALSDDLIATASRTVSFTAGSFYANNKNITTGFVSASNTSLAPRLIEMGSGTWTVLASTWSTQPTPLITINSNTSTIVFSNTTASISFNGGNRTFYNMVVPGPGLTGLNQFVMTSNDTFNDLTLNLVPGDTNRKVFIHASGGDASITVNGTFTINNASMKNRPFFLNVNGTTTFTVNNVVGFDYVDFRRFVVRGNAVPLNGLYYGDIGGNEGINFNPSKTVYWNQPAGGNWSDTAWTFTSGGALDANAFPLAHDTAIIDSAGTGNNITITVDRSWQIGDVYFNTNNAIAWSFSNTTPDIGGNVVFGSSTTATGNGILYFSPGRNSNVFVDFKNATIPIRTDFQPILGGSITLVSNTTVTNRVTFVQGTLNLNNNLLSCANLFTSYTSNRTINFGNTGEIRLTGTGDGTANGTMFIWDATIANNLVMTGSKIVRGVYSGSVGSRRFDHGTTSGATEDNSPNVYIEPASDAFQYGTGNGASRDFIANVGFTGIVGIPITIYGNFTQSPNCQPTSSIFTRNFAGTQGPYYITLNGTAIDRPVSFNGGGTYILADNFTGGVVPGSPKVFWLQNGTVTAQANVTVGTMFANTNEDLPRTLNMGNGVWTITADDTSGITGTGSVWQCGEFANNLTVNAGNSTIRMTGASHKRFNAAGKTFNHLVQAGTGNLRIQHRGVFGRISNEVDGTLITFLENETHSVTEFAVSNTLISSVDQANTVPGNTFTLQARTGRQNIVQGLTIDHSIASPNGYFYAPTANNNVNNGDNVGWVFEAPKTNRAEFIPLIMPSF